MIRTYASALAHGTYLNRQKQAHCYITFAVLYNVPYLFPSPVHICMYSQYLANKMHSLSSIKNYISGARTWVLEHGGNPTVFSGYENSMMVRAITKASGHVVKRATPLTLDHILKIVAYLDKARNAPLAVKPCIHTYRIFLLFTCQQFGLSFFFRSWVAFTRCWPNMLLIMEMFSKY